MMTRATPPLHPRGATRRRRPCTASRNTSSTSPIPNKCVAKLIRPFPERNARGEKRDVHAPPSRVSVALRYRERDSLPFLEPELCAFTENRDGARAQEAAWRADAERYLARRVFPKIERAGFRYASEIVAYETDTTSVGEIVCERAVDCDAVAVVMAAQGKGRVREFFVGSVTNYCLHRCAKPVVVFRAPADAAEKAEKKRREDAKKKGAKGEEANGAETSARGAPQTKEDADDAREKVSRDDAPKSAAMFF